MTVLSTILEHRFKLALFFSITVVSGIAGYIAYKTGRRKQDKQKEQHSISRNRKKQNISFDSDDDVTSICKQPQPAYRKQQETNRSINDTELQKSPFKSLYSKYYFDEILRIRQVLDKLDNFGVTVQNIFMFSPVIVLDEYEKFNQEMKCRRRLIRTMNEKQYIDLIMEQKNQLEALLERSRMDIVEECGIDADKFERMVVSFEATEDIGVLMRNVKAEFRLQVILAKADSLKRMSIKTLDKILKQKIFFIKSKMYDRLRNKLQDDYKAGQDQILNIVMTAMDDTIYEQFAYEKQEIQQAMVQYKHQMPEQIKQFTRCLRNLENDIGNFGYDSQAESQSDDEGPKRPLSLGNTQANQSENEME